MDVAQCGKVHRLKVIRLGPSVQHLLPAIFAAIVVLVSHRVWSNVKSQADRLSCVLHVAATLNDILGCDLEGRWTIFLLEAASEVALMVVFPLKHA